MNERLRTKGRWIFAALAAIFALMFVVAGVGSTGTGPSILDLLQNQPQDVAADQGNASDAVKKAQRATRENPEDGRAWLTLAEAQVGDDKLTDAVKSADRAGTLLPADDVDAQRQLVGIYLAEAGAASAELQQLFAQQSAETAEIGAVSPSVVPAQQLNAFQEAQQQASGAVGTRYSEKINKASERSSASYGKAIEAQRRVAEANPDDPSAWFQLGEIQAQNYDLAGAIKSYRRFLRLAPNDPIAQQVKDQIKELRELQNPQPEAAS